VVSDLHLGLGSAGDLLRRASIRDRLLSELEDVDRLVLLGDVIELRDRPLAEVLDACAPAVAAIGEAFAGRELVIVPGNHDHHLIEPWLERRGLDGSPALGLEQAGPPEGTPFEALASLAAPAEPRFAYPGLWLREDVYATHGHYLDRFLTVPTIERLGLAIVERVLGLPSGGQDPLAPPDERSTHEVAEYERVQTPVYAFLYELAQATAGGRRREASPSSRIWQMLGGGDTPSARLRGWLLGSVAVPGAVGVANRLGLGPVRSDLSAAAIADAGFEAMAEVAERLAIDARHLVFGHTHRRGTARPGGGAPRLLNTGSWVHAPGLLGATPAESAYWPGTICLLDDEGEPELRHALDDLTRDQLAAAD
jgi:predicted phosphodiesterase